MRRPPLPHGHHGYHAKHGVVDKFDVGIPGGQTPTNQREDKVPPKGVIPELADRFATEVRQKARCGENAMGQLGPPGSRRQISRSPARHLQRSW